MAVAIDIYNVDYDVNFFQSLKLSVRNKTLERFLENSDIQDLAFAAAQLDEKDCLKILIDQGVNLSVPVRGQQTIMDAIFDRVSNPEKFFSEVLDSKVDLDESSSKQNKVYKLDFRLLRPEEDKQMAVISSLFVATTDTTRIEILQHPLFEIYLQHKWSKVIYLFYLWIALHVVSVACMTAYVSLLTYDIGYHDEALAVIRYIMVVVAPTLFIYGIIQCLVLRPFRFRRYEMWINFGSTILVLVVLGMEAWSGYGARVQAEMPNWVLHMTSAAILLLWIELMMLIGRLPKYGYYAVMFGVVLKNVVKVLLACLCLVIGFALSFSIQFYHKEEFSDPWRALVKTVAMMMGEFDYVDIFHNRNYVQSSSPVSRVTFLVFVILTSIVLMNLMIDVLFEIVQSRKIKNLHSDN
ncbi:hypothetical protein GEV33_000377 [Tenebrio molitor]|uniref:Ion transport domain-containing protein n=1 Tax=Tenebrio molitor TaxID=7067 RepID=A0A8J6LH11_TENMO|nr:hypothetical protein GEV33_000377 [Tenebrio molitor]